MKSSLDVTGDRSDCIDYEFAYVYAMPPRALGDAFIMDFWGLLLRTCGLNDYEIPGLSFSSYDHHVFVAGWAQMRFGFPISLKFSATLYDETRDSFRIDKDGKNICLAKSLVRQLTGKAHHYDVGGYLLWPKGNGNVSIDAVGVVTLEFLTEECMTGEDFEKENANIAFPI